jgi:hypothetical protein
VLNQKQWQAYKRQAETQGSNKNQGDNRELNIAETQGNNKKGSNRRSIEMTIR